MAQAGKLGIHVELKSPARECYDFFMKGLCNLPKMVPDTVQSLQMVQGDLSSVGSVMLLKYDLGVPMAAKIKIIAIDESENTVTYEFIEGDVLKQYSRFTTKLQFVEGCVTWEAEFEKLSELSPNPDIYANFATKLLKGMDNYISRN